MIGTAITTRMQQRTDRLVARQYAEQRATWTHGGHPGDPVLAEILGVNKSTAGVDVNRRTVLGYPAAWRAMTLISGDVAKTPLYLYKRTGEQGKERDKHHPAYPLLRRKSNPELKAFDFKRVLTHHALMLGNGYAFIEHNNAGVPIALWPLNPEVTYPVREVNRDGGDAQLWYVTRVANEEHRIVADDILHIKGMGFDGMRGYSVIQVAMEALGLGLAAQKFGSIYFANGSRSDGILMYPGKLDQKGSEALRTSWQKMHQGLDNAHKTAVLEGGMKYEQLTITNEEAQFLETRNFEIRQVANLFGVPPHKLGDNSKSSYNSLEQENRAYVDQSLDHWFVAWEEECFDKLLSTKEKRDDSHVIEFLRAIMLRADTKTESEVRRREVNEGLISLNEGRSQMNRPPVPGGDKLRIPKNIGILGESEEEPQATDSTGSAARLDAQLVLVSDAVKRVLKIVGNKARRKAKNSSEFIAWVDADFETGSQAVVGLSEPITRAVAPLHDPGRSVLMYLDVANVVYTDLMDLCDTCSPAKLPAAVETLTRDWLTTIPEKFVVDLREQVKGVHAELISTKE